MLRMASISVEDPFQLGVMGFRTVDANIRHRLMEIRPAAIGIRPVDTTFHKVAMRFRSSAANFRLIEVDLRSKEADFRSAEAHFRPAEVDFRFRKPLSTLHFSVFWCYSLTTSVDGAPLTQSLCDVISCFQLSRLTSIRSYPANASRSMVRSVIRRI